MIKKKLKRENGFAASDALIAVLIISLFTGLIATIIYNIYLSNSSIKRMGTATGYITNIFEYIDKAYYDDITIVDLETYINTNSEIFNIENNQINISSNDIANESLKTVGSLNDPLYKININIQYYNKMEGNENKLDLVKKLTVNVIYKLGDKDQTITMTRVKSRERLITPNNPDISLLEIDEGKKAYCIKKISDKWKVCDEKDSSWYNYENGNWATIIISENDLQIGNEIDIDNFANVGDMYVWIPRFAYDVANNSILFLYSSTNKYIDNSSGYNNLSELQNTFTVLTDFKINNEENIGIWVNNASGQAYRNLNAVYERNV